MRRTTAAALSDGSKHARALSDGSAPSSHLPLLAYVHANTRCFPSEKYLAKLVAHLTINQVLILPTSYQPTVHRRESVDDS
jgi:hypothetical protein